MKALETFYVVPSSLESVRGKDCVLVRGGGLVPRYHARVLEPVNSFKSAIKDDLHF